MRTSRFLSIALLSSALALTACGGKQEVATGDLTQRYVMSDGSGRQFGIVALDPISGGSLYDMQGRLIGRIIPPPTNVASAAQY